MGNLLASMIPLALAAAISPTMLTAVVLVLSSKDRPRRRALFFLAGAVITLILIGVAALSISGAAVSQKSDGKSPISAGIDIILGLLLLFMGFRNLVRSRESNKDSDKGGKFQKFFQGGGAGSNFFLGVIFTVTDFTSLVFYFVAAKQARDSGLGFIADVAAMTIVGIAIILPILVPLAITIIAPDISGRLTDSLNQWIKKYGKYIGPAIALLFGVYLIDKGLPIFL